jgi:uncharacterized protein (TIGR02246 family)
MKKHMILGICLIMLLSVSSCGFRHRDKAVREVLMEQQRAWNYGDIERFMQGYLNSPAMIFVSPGGVRMGYEATLNAYKKNYSDMNSMGTMEFDIQNVLNTGPRSAVVMGKWKLTRLRDTPQGHFMVVFRKRKGKWKIVADQTF